MTTPQDTPTVHCRHCNAVMKADWQEPISPRRPGFFLLSCTAEECPLTWQTFSSNTYAEQDLTPYYKQAVK